MYRIRVAVPGDEKRIRELFIEMLQTICQTEDVQGYGTDSLDRYWNDGEDRIYVAEDNEVIAYLSVEVHREEKGDYVYLDDLSVTGKCRGRGIGSTLIHCAEAYAETIGISTILFHVEKANTAAFQLYKRLGYQIYRDDGSRYMMINGTLCGQVLAACGNDCAACPRYTSHPYEKTGEELHSTAELWRKIGYRDHVVTNEEIACTGCKPENWCRYRVVKCCEERGIRTCAECSEYPCVNLEDCFAVTKSFAPACRAACTEDEYEQLKRAFFEKEKNLRLWNRTEHAVSGCKPENI